MIGNPKIKLWSAGALACVLLTAGCAAKKAAFVAPKPCVHPLTIEDFTKPCEPIRGTNNKAKCDGVIITYDCVAPNKNR